MKPVKFASLAAWMVEHLTFGPGSEALAGDLLEELRHGRSAQWYWRQVCTAIAAGVLSRLRAFCIASTLLCCMDVALSILELPKPKHACARNSE